jgi:formylmethanofuran dehydrogenase subunit D
LNDSPETTAMEATLLTGRTWRQGAGMEIGRDSEEYAKAIAICEIGREDMKKIGVHEGDPVRITSDCGSIVVRATRAENPPYPGVIFTPMGVWANSLMSYLTDTTGMPPFKGIKVTVEPAPGEKPLTIKELLREVFS